MLSQNGQMTGKTDQINGNCGDVLWHALEHCQLISGGAFMALSILNDNCGVWSVNNKYHIGAAFDSDWPQSGGFFGPRLDTTRTHS